MVTWGYCGGWLLASNPSEVLFSLCCGWMLMFPIRALLITDKVVDSVRATDEDIDDADGFIEERCVSLRDILSVGWFEGRVSVGWFEGRVSAG